MGSITSFYRHRFSVSVGEECCLLSRHIASSALTRSDPAQDQKPRRYVSLAESPGQ